MRGPLLRNMRVIAGLSAAEVAREASLTRHAVRQAEASHEVAPDTALRYLLAIERSLQQRCSVAGTIRGLVYEARDLLDVEYRLAEGEDVPPRRLPRLSDLVGFGDGRSAPSREGRVGQIASREQAIALARRAVRQQRFLALWRRRLEERAPGRPPGYGDGPGMRILEVKNAALEVGTTPAPAAGSDAPRQVWRVELVEDPPRPDFAGYHHAHTWWISIDGQTGQIIGIASCK